MTSHTRTIKNPLFCATDEQFLRKRMKSQIYYIKPGPTTSVPRPSNSLLAQFGTTKSTSETNIPIKMTQPENKAMKRAEYVPIAPTSPTKGFRMKQKRQSREWVILLSRKDRTIDPRKGPKLNVLRNSSALEINLQKALITCKRQFSGPRKS